MENTFGNSAASKFLEDLLLKYPKDKPVVSRLLSNIFEVMNNIECNPNYEFISLLVVNDFTNRLEVSKHSFGQENIKSLMRNLVVAKRKKKVRSLHSLGIAEKKALTLFNNSVEKVREYLTSKNCLDFTEHVKYNERGKEMIYGILNGIEYATRNKNKKV